ncbi:MAG: ion transporter [Lachnospiraceae bacterium]|nr:ion transporter [Lachnospiraceae bacterium]
MKKIKYHIFKIIQIGSKEDLPSRLFDYFIVVMIFLNLFATIFMTFDESKPYTGMLNIIELITSVIFAVEYGFRLWTAEYLYPDKNKFVATIAFIFSFYGLIDLLAFFPYFLPFVFASGAVAFRIFRVIRIFRLFKINAQYDAFNVITDVLKEKRNQLISSMVLILILLVASSLCMYSLENEAQPDVFNNAFSGIWWATSTMLTVGYGDIYPITIGGRIMAILISFLGVGVVAIPTGIISAGFVEHYTQMKRNDEINDGISKFVTSQVEPDHPWCSKALKEIVFPPDMAPVMIVRKGEMIKPQKDFVLKVNDVLVFEPGNHI